MLIPGWVLFAMVTLDLDGPVRVVVGPSETFVCDRPWKSAGGDQVLILSRALVSSLTSP